MYRFINKKMFFIYIYFPQFSTDFPHKISAENKNQISSEPGYIQQIYSILF